MRVGHMGEPVTKEKIKRKETKIHERVAIIYNTNTLSFILYQNPPSRSPPA